MGVACQLGEKCVACAHHRHPTTATPPLFTWLVFTRTGERCSWFTGFAVALAISITWLGNHFGETTTLLTGGEIANLFSGV